MFNSAPLGSHANPMIAATLEEAAQLSATYGKCFWCFVESENLKVKIDDAAPLFNQQQVDRFCAALEGSKHV